ncbi:DNA-binding protein [Colletotrichum orchidophilum]|uniref:DNA-binding protein n=1 Tax=Colletotrichum orchidophilum TaxID=1209926 RepID=A0A1G4B8E9_9PEZI|nr:DNA-binding protein [Colletotrichum orchidophilum]OHE97711.1 DNA-binding protein [Colletotrichum orchidophilum]
MVKGTEEVISEFNEYVNMTAEDLESWLKSDDSNSAGWPKDDAEGGGESVGHDSGRKIVEILQANPDKKEDKYTDEQVEHMRKVVAYCKRHLAQESKSNSDKSPEEVKKTKSYASLKNWGHDFLKAQGKENGATKSNGKSSKTENGNEGKAESNGSKKQNGSKKGEEEVEDDKEEEEAEDETEEKAGDKRKNASEENGSSKKRQTRQGEGKSTGKSDENGDDEQEEAAEENGVDGDEEMEDDDEEGDDKENGGGKPKKGPKKGDTVSWNWGNGQPEGKVLDVKGEKTTITTKRGNEVSREGNPEDPAVVLDTGKSKAIKSAHELN